MEKIVLVVWAITGLLTVANAVMVSYDEECGGSGGNHCDVTKGLICDKQWVHCASSTGVCTCKPDLAWDGHYGQGECKRAVTTFDGACDDTRACVSPFVCTNSQCKCPTDFTYDADHINWCKDNNKAIIGTACTSNDGCESGNCVDNQGTRKCTCNTGYEVHKQGCKKSDSTAGQIANGAPCTSSDDCGGTTADTCVACGKGTGGSTKKCKVADAVTDAIKTAVGGHEKMCEGTTGNGCDSTLGLECATLSSGSDIRQCKCSNEYTWNTDKCTKESGSGNMVKLSISTFLFIGAYVFIF